jgi:hypothetical protein
MNASKENARAALSKLSKSGDPDTGFIREFLEAAERKLPSEKAFANAKKKTGKRQKASTK